MFWIDAGTYPGNSSGPILNERGKLIGIVSRSNLRTRTVAVPLEYVDNLLKTLVPRRIVSISNDLSFTIHFQFRVTESDNWEKTTVDPEETAVISFSGPHKTVEIRFDHVVNDDAVSYHYQELQTYQRRTRSGFNPSRKYDAREYHFDYNRVTERLELQDSEGN